MRIAFLTCWIRTTVTLSAWLELYRPKELHCSLDVLQVLHLNPPTGGFLSQFLDLVLYLDPDHWCLFWAKTQPVPKFMETNKPTKRLND